MFESGSKGCFREVCASKFGVVGQGGLDDGMDGRSRGSGRHEEIEVFMLLRTEGTERGRENKEGFRVRCDGRCKAVKLLKS